MSDKNSFKRNRQILYSCKYHVVFCPKYRRKVLVEGVDIRLKEIIYQVATELSCEVMELEVMPDHVHMLCEVDPQLGVHKFVRRVKGRSSRLLRQEYPQLKRKLPTLWTNSYLVSTVGGAPMAIWKQYIEAQKNV
jgi:putative transposase